MILVAVLIARRLCHHTSAVGMRTGQLCDRWIEISRIRNHLVWIEGRKDVDLLGVSGTKSHHHGGRTGDRFVCRIEIGRIVVVLIILIFG